MKELNKNINKLHTTELGIKRIKRNIKISDDVVEYCKKIVLDKNSKIYIKGKNYYCKNNNIVITINAKSYTIITAHIIKGGDYE